MLCLTLTSIQLSGQSILISSHQVRSVLKDRAELEMRRADAIADSIATQELLRAYYYKDSALRYSEKAREEADRIAQDWHSLSVINGVQAGAYKKEARKQKRLKWLGLAGMAIFAALAAL